MSNVEQSEASEVEEGPFAIPEPHGTKSVGELADSLFESLGLRLPPGFKRPVVTGKCPCGRFACDLFDNATECGNCRNDRENRAAQRQMIIDWTLEQMPKRYRWCESFDVPELAKRVKVPSAIAKARNAVREERIVLLGPSGGGKTSLACTIAMENAKAGRRVRFVDALELAAARAHHGLGEGEAPLVQLATSARILVLDDLGAERATPNSAIADVIHKRHGDEAPTIITTGFSAQAIGERYGSGIARRIFEDALVIDMFAKGAR